MIPEKLQQLIEAIAQPDVLFKEIVKPNRLPTPVIVENMSDLQACLNEPEFLTQSLIYAWVKHTQQVDDEGLRIHPTIIICGREAIDLFSDENECQVTFDIAKLKNNGKVYLACAFSFGADFVDQKALLYLNKLFIHSDFSGHGTPNRFLMNLLRNIQSFNETNQISKESFNIENNATSLMEYRFFPANSVELIFDSVGKKYHRFMKASYEKIEEYHQSQTLDELDDNSATTDHMKAIKKILVENDLANELESRVIVKDLKNIQANHALLYLLNNTFKLSIPILSYVASQNRVGIAYCFIKNSLILLGKNGIRFNPRFVPKPVKYTFTRCDQSLTEVIAFDAIIGQLASNSNKLLTKENAIFFLKTRQKKSLSKIFAIFEDLEINLTQKIVDNIKAHENHADAFYQHLNVQHPHDVTQEAEIKVLLERFWSFTPTTDHTMRLN
ncbi:MAG: hypothetical protein KIT27_10455 [Legionellales bacterium]|nr:hypothetical protein [Legionellales bacterium]